MRSSFQRGPCGLAFSYDTDDRLVTTADPLNRVTSYAYDAAGRTISASNAAISSSPLVQFAYTPSLRTAHRYR